MQESQSIETAWLPQSDVLLVAFSGFPVAHQPDPHFQFRRITRSHPVNKIYVRDLNLAWYHRGLVGISTNIDETVDYFRALLEPRKFRRIVFIGVSAGGYAALLFGKLLSINEVHAFSPRTFLDSVNRKKHRDTRLADYVEQLYQSDQCQECYFDLRIVFQQRPECVTDANIYYCGLLDLDIAHGEHLRGLPGVRLWPVPYGGHALAGYLAREGHIDEILERAFL